MTLALRENLSIAVIGASREISTGLGGAPNRKPAEIDKNTSVQKKDMGIWKWN